MPESDSSEMMSTFSAFDTPLSKGVSLIEASAGTGKTFSIAMLVLRFIVEEKLTIEQVLVVTFTKAATQELRTRIRSRLQDLRNYLLNAEHQEALDDAFIQWADQLDDPQTVVTNVSQALASIDNAAIFTIHSFCQRMLRQYALESGQLFDAELTANLDNLTASLAEDYWREQLYDASPLKASLLGSRFATPQALLASIKNIHQNMVIVPEKQDIDGLVATIESNSQHIAATIDASLILPLSMLIARDKSFFKEAFLNNFEFIKHAVLAWVSSDSSRLPISALQALSIDRLMSDALHGGKFRKTKALTSEERKLSFLADAGISVSPESAVLDDTLQQIEQLSISLRLGLFEMLQDKLDAKKDSLSVLAYDDLIARLADALHGTDDLLIASLRRQFSVALIDEFQDTDQQQWDIFSGVYNTPDHYLYLIGDPKQAVYKFRGADIYSYLEAKHAANHHYTLDKNYRSAPKLLQAINVLYSQSTAPFLIDDIPFYPVSAGKAEDEHWGAGKLSQGLMLWYLEDNPDHKQGYWTSGSARTVIRCAVVNEIVSLLGNLNNDSKHSLRPQDIAILVRGNEEAANYQAALQKARVPAVINSKSSVFECDEAIYLQQLLTALERPADLHRLRQALVVPWFDLDGQAFDALSRDDDALQHYVTKFQAFQLMWQEQGLMAMMRTLLADYQVMQVLTRGESPERRMTNLHHLLEIIQAVVLQDRLDSHKTLEWLGQAIHGEHREEGTELRLEQDEEAVNIVTIHSAKGLEYPVVFVPELWYERKSPSAPPANQVVTCHKAGQLIADLGSKQLTEHFEQAQFEQQAEDLRLLYVAITRAANRCYVPWATVRTLSRDNQSALAYLLEPHAGDDWQGKLSNLAAAIEGIECEVISAEQTSTQLPEHLTLSKALQAKVAQRTIYQRWRMSSYSSLAYLSQHEHELPQDKSQEPVEVDTLQSDAEPEVVLPKGAHTGNVLHDLLEHNSFKHLKHLDSTAAHYKDYAALRDKSCARYGLALTPETEGVLDDLLKRSVQAPLSAGEEGFYLANLDDNQCLKEMAFYFSVDALQTQAINALLVNEPSYQPLSMRELSGQLTGFIDLICVYEERFYVMDYKSNSLTDYKADSLQYAMRQHNYGLQYFIYSLVLHHYLQQRLPDYHYDEHFGGVRYLFLRGMDKSHAMQGVFVDKPSLEIIEGLGRILTGGEQ